LTRKGNLPIVFREEEVIVKLKSEICKIQGINSAVIFLQVLLLVATVVHAGDTVKKSEQNPVCVIKTAMGDIHVELFKKEAPKTVENFLALAGGTREFVDPKTKERIKRPFYDGLIFNRVIKNFMIQGGCPLGTGSGSPGYNFENEINADALGLGTEKAFDRNNNPHKYLSIRSQKDYDRIMQEIMRPLLKSMGIKSQDELKKREAEVRSRLKGLSLKDVYTFQGYAYNDKLGSHPPERGVIAMANSGPNTNGSQFFINMVDTPWLKGKHTVFGKVVKGMEIVDKIGQVKVGAGSKPVKDVTILSIRTLKSGD